MEPIVQIIISLVVFLPLSLFLLISGWLCLHSGIGVLYPPHHIAILITRIGKGKKAAIAIKRGFIEKQKEKMVGYRAIVAGVILVLITTALFVDAIPRM